MIGQVEVEVCYEEQQVKVPLLVVKGKGPSLFGQDWLTKILEPVQFADWAAPIVPVVKSDGKSFRICGDFKLTVNQASKLDRYPIPKVEDLFLKLTGGKAFTKLDVSQAYQQLVLDEESRKYAVINTHRGLFRYNRLRFGSLRPRGFSKE